MSLSILNRGPSLENICLQIESSRILICIIQRIGSQIAERNYETANENPAIYRETLRRPAIFHSAAVSQVNTENRLGLLFHVALANPPDDQPDANQGHRHKRCRCHGR